MLGGLIVAVITLAVTLPMTDFYKWFTQPKPTISVLALAISIPTDGRETKCNLVLDVQNSANVPQTLDICKIEIYNKVFEYTIPTGDARIRVDQHDRRTYFHEFSNARLTRLFKYPPTHVDSSIIEILYTLADSDDTVSVTVLDGDVVRCNYWQIHKFLTAEEPHDLELHETAADFVYFSSNDSTGSRVDTIGLAIFRPSEEMREVLYPVMDNGTIPTPNFPISVRPSIFLRRYGGIYVGIPSNSSSILNIDDLTAANYFSRTTNPLVSELKNELHSLNVDSSDQFILYSFDLAKSDSISTVVEENSKVLLNIIHEGHLNTDEVGKAAEALGFHFDFEQKNQETVLPGLLYALPSAVKIFSFADYLNVHLKEYNEMIDSSGVVFLWTSGQVDSSVIKLAENAASVLNKSSYRIWGFNCRPFSKPFLKAPLADVMVAIVFDTSNSGPKKIDSLELRITDGIKTWHR